MQNRNIAFFLFFHSQPALVGCKSANFLPFHCLPPRAIPGVRWKQCLGACALWGAWWNWKTHLSPQSNASFFTPPWTMTGQREETCAWQEAQRGLGREEAYLLSGQPPPGCSVVDEATAVAALTTTMVGTAAALAQTLIASPLLAQCLHLLILCGNMWRRWPFDPETDPLLSQREAWCSSLMGGYVVIQLWQLTAGRNSIGKHSAATVCGTNDGVAYAGDADDGVAFTGAAAMPTMAPTMPMPWSVHLPSYPLRVICRFCFKREPWS